MSKREQHAPAKTWRAFAALAAFMLLFILGQAREGRAQWETSGGDIRSTNGGAVGIGVASNEPASLYYKLDVRGLGIFGLTRKLSLNADFGGNGEWAAGAAVTSLGNNSIFFAASPDLGSAGAKAGMAYFNGAGWYSAAEIANVAGGGGNRGSLLLMRGGGNVGIGTASPSNRLHVAGNNTAAGGYPILKLENTQSGGHSYWLYAGAQGAAGAFGLYDQTAGAYRLFVTEAGLLGVGTTSPLGTLHVPDGQVVIGQNYYRGATLRVGRNDANYPGIVTATNFNDGDKPIYRARSNNAAGLSGDGLYTFLAHNDATVRTFSADHHGNGYFAGSVGIGTTTPGASYKLDVNGAANVAGSLNVTGTITGGAIEARYQDVAEWVPSVQKLSAGTVVVLDAARSNHVLASTSAYDTSVAGVVSEQPGIILGEGGEGRVKVATTGRVRVRVDATKGAIKIGDLLVTSDTHGVAMRSEPLTVGGRRLHAPGTIIGKALEPLAGGVGEILVLLSMQ